MSDLRVKFPKALTWRVWFILISAAIVVQPAIIYWYLISGMGLPLQTWIIILVALEIASLTGRPLSVQETFIISSFAGVSLTAATFFITPLRNLYFSINSITQDFGIAEHIPAWWAPRDRAIEIFASRSFFHLAWLTPLSIMTVIIILTFICNISLGLLLYEIYAVEEKLEFPAYRAAAQTIVTLVERRSEEFKALILMIMAGVLYNVLTFFIPFMLGSPQLQILHRGLIDMTHYVEGYFPGATFGITTDVMIHLVGFLLPIGVTLSMFIGAFAIYFFGNYYVTVNDLWPPVVPWHAGLGMQQVVYQSQLYFWYSLSIGLALAAFIVPIILHPQVFTRAFRSLARAAQAKMPGRISPYKLLLIFFLSSLSGVMLTHFLAPDFPIWILLLFSVGGSLFASFVQTHSLGVTFGGFGVPYLQQMMIYYSGNRGWNIWFAPMLQSVGGPGLAGALVQARICRTSPRDYIKALIVVTALAYILSFAYVSLFWKVSGIPGSAYPYTITGWQAENQAWARWFKFLWSGYLFHDYIIIGSFIAGVVIAVLTDKLIHAPFVLISLLSGIFLPPPLVVGSMVTGVVGGEMTGGRITALTQTFPAGTFGLAYGPIPTTLAQLIGSIIGNFVLRKRFGDERWGRIAPLTVMGFAIGDGLMWAAAFTIAMIGRSLWLLPY